MLSLVLRTLLYDAPQVIFSDAEIKEYEKINSTIKNGELLTLDHHISKYRFLLYLSQHHNYLFHGSNHPSIDEFEPREQTLYNNKLTKAVFASSEPMWSIFYAVFDRSKLVGSFRNGCLVYKNKKYHFYSLNESTKNNDPWTEGVIYLLPRDTFVQPDQKKLHFDEWICHDYVKPLGKIKVNASDFIYKNKVATHQAHESLIKTWLLYKRRTRNKKQGDRYDE